MTPYPIECHKATNIQEDIIIPLYEAIETRLDNFVGQQSGWNLFSVDFIELEVNGYTPLRVGMTLYPTVKQSEKNDNEDTDCLKWAILDALYGDKTKVYSTKDELKQYENSIDWSMIKFPVDVFYDTHMQKLICLKDLKK